MSHTGNGIIMTALGAVVIGLAIFGAIGLACVTPVFILAVTKGSAMGVTSAAAVAVLEIYLWVKFVRARA